MKFEIRDSNNQLKKDSKCLEGSIKYGLYCPKCKTGDGLKLQTKMRCNVFMYCDYKIECRNCGYEQDQWYDTTALAIDALKAEGLKGMIHE